jgi:hypothetical protein
MVAYAPLYYGGGVLHDPLDKKLTIPYGDDYSINIVVTLPSGADPTSCTAVMALSKSDESSVRIEKACSVGQYAGEVYVTMSLAHDDFLVLKPGRYNYDIEVRSSADEFWTRISSTLKIKKTFVKHV